MSAATHTLSDEALAAELCPDDLAEGLRIVAGLTRNKRVMMELLIAKANELALHEAGLGPMPVDVMVTRLRGKFRRWKSRR